MKFLRTLNSTTIASLAVFIGSTPLLAQGTWVEVHRDISKKGVKYAYFIEMMSIVNRDDIAYFNYGVKLVDIDGNLKKTEGASLNQIKRGGRINCKNKTVYFTKNNGVWSPISNEDHILRSYNKAFPIVCKGNKPNWKFW